MDGAANDDEFIYITPCRFNSQVTIPILLDHFNSILDHIDILLSNAIEKKNADISSLIAMVNKIKNLSCAIILSFLHVQIDHFNVDSSCDRIFNSLEAFKKPLFDLIISYEKEFDIKHQKLIQFTESGITCTHIMTQ